MTFLEGKRKAVCNNSLYMCFISFCAVISLSPNSFTSTSLIAYGETKRGKASQFSHEVGRPPCTEDNAVALMVFISRMLESGLASAISPRHPDMGCVS